MKQYLLFFCVVALLASCNKPDDNHIIDPASDGQVSFVTNISDKANTWTTRGAITDNDNIADFGAFCFRTGRKSWSSVAATALPDKMFNVSVTRNGSDWEYNPSVKWEAGDGSYFTFFGYSPRATGIYQEPDNSSGNNIEVTTTADDAGVPKLRYTTLDYVPAQVDLLLAAPVYNTGQVDRVEMKFEHALSQIRFKAWSEQDFVKVKGIEISNIQYAATFSLDGTITAEPATKTFMLDVNKSLSTDENNATDLSDGGNAFMLLPQDLTGNTAAYITVTYEVGGVTDTSTPYQIKENWTKSKSFTYSIKLGGVPTKEMVVTGVTMTDWAIDSEEDMETNPVPYKIHPPTPDQYVEIKGLKWTTGNLVAVNKKECKVGASEDDGVYFQFGSLIGHKGGLYENGGNGTGRQAKTGFNSFIWGGVVGTWSPDNDMMVWPYNLSSIPPTWPQESTTQLWYFDAGYGYSTDLQNIRDYPGLATGELSKNGVGDPCTFYLGDPWRMPTAEEFLSITNNKGNLDGTPVAFADAGITYEGKLASFTGQTLTMTGAGSRNGNGWFGGLAVDADRYGNYWSSSVSDGVSGYSFHFEKAAGVRVYYSQPRGMAYPARCVSGTYTPPAPVPVVGDYYYSDGTFSTALNAGKTATGMIFYIDPNDATKYKVMSLEESATTLKWAKKREYTPGANDKSDSRGNAAVIKAAFDSKLAGIITESTFAEAFPAAGYCYNYKGKAGTDLEGTWYLPAVNDLSYMWCAYDGKAPVPPYYSLNPNTESHANWNARIQAAGVAQGITEDYSWSSTEPNPLVSFSDGSTAQASKENNYKVRCMRDI